MSTIREIEKQVHESARRMKVDERNKIAAEKHMSTETAVAQRVHLEEELSRKRLDYVKLLKMVFSIIAIALIWLIVYFIVKSAYCGKKDPWKRSIPTSADFKNASEFVNKKILKSKNAKNINTLFSQDIPERWKVMGRKNLEKVKLSDFTVTKVLPDNCKLGDEMLFFVECENADSVQLLFTIESKRGDVKIVRISLDENQKLNKIKEGNAK